MINARNNKIDMHKLESEINQTLICGKYEEIEKFLREEFMKLVSLNILLAIKNGFDPFKKSGTIKYKFGCVKFIFDMSPISTLRNCEIYGIDYPFKVELKIRYLFRTVFECHWHSDGSDFEVKKFKEGNWTEIIDSAFQKLIDVNEEFSGKIRDKNFYIFECNKKRLENLLKKEKRKLENYSDLINKSLLTITVLKKEIKALNGCGNNVHGIRE